MLFWRRRRNPGAALTGVPPVRREKTYSAESGYVYRYYFQGYRRVTSGNEYVFEVHGGIVPARSISIWLQDSVLHEWQANRRELTASERYALAKMSFFRTLDLCPAPNALGDATPSTAEIMQAADALSL